MWQRIGRPRPAALPWGESGPGYDGAGRAIPDAPPRSARMSHRPNPTAHLAGAARGNTHDSSSHGRHRAALLGPHDGLPRRHRRRRRRRRGARARRCRLSPPPTPPGTPSPSARAEQLVDQHRQRVLRRPAVLRSPPGTPTAARSTPPAPTWPPAKQQIAVAEQTLAGQGWGAWACAYAGGGEGPTSRNVQLQQRRRAKLRPEQASSSSSGHDSDDQSSSNEESSGTSWDDRADRSWHDDSEDGLQLDRGQLAPVTAPAAPLTAPTPSSPATPCPASRPPRA